MTRWTAIAVLAVVAAALQPVAAPAQTSDAVGVVTTIDGRATVARPALASPLSLKFKDDVFGRDRISTQENSLVRVLLGGKAILTVRELSEVTISEEPGRAVVTLPSGKVVLAVQKQRMRPGESIEIRTPNAVAAVRGSVLAVAYDTVQKQTTAICHSGDCTFQYAGGATNPLPPGQGAKNGQTGPVTQAERTAAVNVEPSSHAFSGPDEGFQTSLFQTEAGKAIQVAEFASTGTLPGTPSLNPSPSGQTNGLTNHPEITDGSTTKPTPPPPAPTGGGGTSGGGGTPGGGGGTGGGGTPVGSFSNGGFETGSFSSWTLSGAGAVLGSLGPTPPPQGSFMGMIFTGGNAIGGSTSTLSQSFNVTGGKL